MSKYNAVYIYRATCGPSSWRRLIAGTSASSWHWVNHKHGHRRLWPGQRLLWWITRLVFYVWHASVVSIGLWEPRSGNGRYLAVLIPAGLPFYFPTRSFMVHHNLVDLSKAVHGMSWQATIPFVTSEACRVLARTKESIERKMKRYM